MIKNRPRRLERLFVDSPLFFLTIGTRDRKQIPSLELSHETFVRYAVRAWEQFNVAVGRYVVMPTHLHLFVQGDTTFDVSQWTAGLKRALSKAVAAGSAGLWQPGFFDHVLRNDESYVQKWEYVRENPVRAGLVATADQWPFQGEIVRIDRA